MFVRNDVYDHLMRNSPDYGKELRATLDWNDADMLREMLRLRLVSGMHGDLDEMDFQTVWHELCSSHYRGEETSSYLIDRSLMRPRNVLKLSCLSMKLSKAAETQRMSHRGFQSLCHIRVCTVQLPPTSL